MNPGYSKENKSLLGSLYTLGKDLAKDWSKARRLRSEYPNAYLDEYTPDASGLSIYLGSRGERVLNEKQLEKLRVSFRNIAWSEESNMRLITRLAELRVVDSKIALRESGIAQASQGEQDIRMFNYAEYLGYLLARLRVIAREIERQGSDVDELQAQYDGYEKLVDTLQLVYVS